MRRECGLRGGPVPSSAYINPPCPRSTCRNDAIPPFYNTWITDRPLRETNADRRIPYTIRYIPLGLSGKVSTDLDIAGQ